jgi:hypothetical protein
MTRQSANDANDELEKEVFNDSNVCTYCFVALRRKHTCFTVSGNVSPNSLFAWLGASVA